VAFGRINGPGAGFHRDSLVYSATHYSKSASCHDGYLFGTSPLIHRRTFRGIFYCLTGIFFTWFNFTLHIFNLEKKFVQHCCSFCSVEYLIRQIILCFICVCQHCSLLSFCYIFTFKLLIFNFVIIFSFFFPFHYFTQ
jgi:hypothetical protein